MLASPAEAVNNPVENSRSARGGVPGSNRESLDFGVANGRGGGRGSYVGVGRWTASVPPTRVELRPAMGVRDPAQVDSRRTALTLS